MSNSQIAKEIQDTIVFILQICLAILGFFGHFMIIYATFKKKEIRTKHGLLMFELSCCQIFCIIGELYTITLHVFTIKIQYCIYSLYLILTFEYIQSMIMLMISIDLLFTVLVPLIYRLISVNQSVIITLTICSVFTSVYVFFLFFLEFQVFSSERSFCRPFYSKNFAIFTFCVFLSIASIQISVYTISYSLVAIRSRLFEKKNPTQCYRNVHRKTMRTIFVLNIVFILTWISAMLLSQVASYFDLSTKWKHNILIYESVLSMINYIQSFYVALWRSSEYRKIFKSIWKSSKIIKKLSYPKIKDCCVVVVDRSKFSVGFVSTEPRL